MRNRSAKWIESTTAKVPLPLRTTSFIIARLLFSSEKHQQYRPTADLHSAEKTDMWKEQKHIFSITWCINIYTW